MIRWRLDQCPEVGDERLVAVAGRRPEHDVRAGEPRHQRGHHRRIDMKEWQSAEEVAARAGVPASAISTIRALATSLPCVRRAIFGAPVVPPVQNHDEGSSGRTCRPLTSASPRCESIAVAEFRYRQARQRGDGTVADNENVRQRRARGEVRRQRGEQVGGASGRHRDQYAGAGRAQQVGGLLAGAAPD